MDTTRTQTGIVVERPSEQRLRELNVATWPIWTKTPSTFEWHYDERETCYLLEGEVTVSTDAEDVTLRAGDLVTFPPGLSCTWQVRQPIRKHYRFG
jgi:uncharacterized cupin superfamily protein